MTLNICDVFRFDDIVSVFIKLLDIVLLLMDWVLLLFKWLSNDSNILKHPGFWNHRKIPRFLVSGQEMTRGYRSYAGVWLVRLSRILTRVGWWVRLVPGIGMTWRVRVV